MEKILNDTGILLTSIGFLVALTNIVTEVVKKVTWNKIPTQLLATIISEMLTISSGVAYFQIKQISITWYLIVATIVLGLLVAYAAMFGFEKLKEILESFGGISHGRKR